MLSISQVKFLNGTNGIRIANNAIELLLSLDFGPRIVSFKTLQGENHLHVRTQDYDRQDLSQFLFYGGHRLWAAPEDLEKTYVPDNNPLHWQQVAGVVTITQTANEKQPLEKQISISMHSELPQVRLEHFLTNRSTQTLEYAPWAITQLATGGMGIMPLPARGRHQDNLLPNGSLVLWAYTNLSDPRWRWGYEFIRVQQDPQIAEPLKFGMAASLGWLAYQNHGQVFLKQTTIQTGKSYPDRGTPIQIFANDEMLELETLGPTEAVEPGQFVSHVESWQLIDRVPPIENDRGVQQYITPRLIGF